MTLSTPDELIAQTKRMVETEKRTELRLRANGGNSVLLVCPPPLEKECIQSLATHFSPDQYQIIDLEELLLEFVETQQADLPELFDMLKGSVEQIFKASEGETGPDLFGSIMEAIGQAFSQNRVPVLIRTGALYGSGIDSIHIMESSLVMKSHLPLLLLYPATRADGQLLFLSRRPASKYRCMIIE
jgi:hypothetical protein